MSGISLGFGYGGDGQINARFAAHTVTPSTSSGEYSHVQLLASSRGFWLYDWTTIGTENLSFGVFAAAQLDGAVDAAITIPSQGPAVTVTGRQGTSTTDLYTSYGPLVLTGTLLHPIWCPPSQYLLFGSRSAATNFSAMFRLLEYFH